MAEYAYYVRIKNKWQEKGAAEWNVHGEETKMHCALALQSSPSVKNPVSLVLSNKCQLYKTIRR